MSDAQFIFETNITEVVGQIRAGLRQLTAATTESAGRPAGELVRQVAPGVTRDVEAAILQYRRLHEEAIKAFGLGDSLAGGSFARQAGAIAAEVSGQIRQRVGDAATKQISAGTPLSTSEINAALKAAQTPVEEMKKGAEELITVMRRFAGEMGVQTFGSLEELNKAAKAGARNLGRSIEKGTFVPSTGEFTSKKLTGADQDYLRASQQATRSVDDILAAAALHVVAERTVTAALDQQASAADQHAKAEQAASDALEEAARTASAQSETLAGAAQGARNFATAEERAAVQLSAFADEISRQAVTLKSATRAGSLTGAFDVPDVRRLGQSGFALGTGPDTQFVNATGNRPDPNAERRLAAADKEYQESLAAAKAKAESAAADKAQAQASRALEAAEREMQRALKAASQSGILNSFLGGLTSSGFGGKGGFSGNFEGLARSAGQAVKYNLLYQALGQLQTAAGAAIKQFLDFDDSIVELQVAMRTGSTASAEFVNNLQDVAALGGFNVGEAMDVAASGIRAFRQETDGTDASLQTLGQSFATQAARIAVLTKTTLPDASGNLKAIAAGFQLSKNNLGFVQVTDAIAGAKVLGGGNEKDIGQGLASGGVALRSELGFSLQESAAIISKINAETDESGQLIATRLTRLGSIIGGGAGKTFISNLNASLNAADRIDTTASLKDQILQLSAAYQKAGDSQKQVINSRLGGTTQGKELIILLQNASDIVSTIRKDGDNLFAGKGDEEFQLRLGNAATQLKQIQGYVSAIVVNLGRSGLATPFLEVVSVVREITKLGEDITQQFAKWAGAIAPVGVVLGPVVSALAALRAFGAVSAAGGIGGFLANQEARFAPVRAAARSQLAESARQGAAQTNALTATADPKVAAEKLEIAQAKLSAALTALAEDTNGLAAKTQVAAARVEVAVAELDIKQANVAALPALKTQRTAFGKAQFASQTGAAEEGVANARANVAGLNAEHLALQQALLKEQEQAAVYERRKVAIEQENVAALTKIQAKLLLAAKTGDTEQLATLERERIAVQAQLVEQLKAVSAEEIAARVATVDAETASTGRLAAIGGGLKSFFTGAGGLFTLGLAALDVGSRLKDASDQIQAAQKDAADAINQGVGPGIQGLRDAADANAAAAAELKQAASGFFGGIAAGGSGVTQAQQQRQAVADILRRGADAAAVAQALAKQGQGNSAQLAGTLDTSSSDALAQSLKVLHDEGFTASQVMDALATAIGNLKFVSTNQAANLPAEVQADLAARVGKDAVNALANRQQSVDAEAAKLTGLVKSRSGINNNTDPKVAAAIANAVAAKQEQALLAKVNPEGVGKTLQQVTSDFLAKHSTANLNESGLQAKLKDAYATGLKLDNFGLDPQTIEQIASDAIRGLNDELTNRKLKINTAADLQSAVSAVPGEADLVGQDVTRQSKLKSIATGTADTSQFDGLKARRAAMEEQLKNLQAVGETLKGAGSDPGTVDRIVNQLKNGISDTDIAIAEAAKSAISEDQRVTEILQKRSKSKAQIKRLGQAAFARDAAIAVDSGDLTLIEEVFAAGSKKEIAMIQATVAETLAAAKAKAIADAAVASAANSALHALGSAAESEDRRLSAESGTNSSVSAQAVAKAQASFDQVNAAIKAIGTPANLYDTGKLGGGGGGGGGGGKKDGTAAQIAAAREAALADQQRNSLLAAKATLDAAAADRAAAKTTLERAKADGAYYQALNAYRDALQAAKLAVSKINAFPDSELQNATFALNEAKLNVNKFAKGTAEWAAAQAAFVQATRQLQQAQVDLNINRLKLASDLTDPVAQAAIATKAALSKVQLDTKNKAPVDVLTADKVALAQAQASEESSAFSQKLQDAQTAEQLGRTSHAAYLSYLRSEHDRLSSIQNKTRQQTDELNQIDQAIKSANQSLQGQFNLGDIRVPTVYEVRRAVQNATASSAITANTSSTVTNNVTINGADFTKVVDYLTNTLGASGSGRSTLSIRRA